MIGLSGGKAGERVKVVNIIHYCFYMTGEAASGFCPSVGNIQTWVEWLSAMDTEVFIRGP